MKKLAFALSAVALTFALGACTDDDPDDDVIVPPAPVVSVSPSTSVMPVPSASASPSVSVKVVPSASTVYPCQLLDGQARRVCESNDVPGDGGR